MWLKHWVIVINITGTLVEITVLKMFQVILSKMGDICKIWEKIWPTFCNSFFHKLYLGWIMKQFDVFIKISLSMNCVRALITGKCSCFFSNMHCPHVPFNLVSVGLLSLYLGGQEQFDFWDKIGNTPWKLLKSYLFQKLFRFDLGLLTFHENSNHGRENY